MWPSHRRPITRTFFPLPTPQWRIGEYVVIPAHRSGAAPATFRFAGTTQYKVFVDNDAVGVTTVGHTTDVFVRRIESKCSCLGKIARGHVLQFGQVRSESTMQPTAI